MPAAVNAQDFPRDIPGVTVTGRATLTAHADILYISATLMPVTGQPDDIQSATAAIVAALQAAGAGDASASYLLIGDGKSGRTISGTLHDPTTASLTAAVQAVSDTVTRYPGAIVERITAALGLSNCAEVENRLQVAALADARARAGRLAAASGVSIGAPSVITPGGLPNYAFPCSPSRGLQRFPAERTLPEDGNVEFGLFVNVTYPIVRP